MAGWGAPALTYQFFADEGQGQAPIALSGVQSSSQYVATSSRNFILCHVVASNAGGYADAFSQHEVMPVFSTTTTTSVTTNNSTSTSPGASTVTTVTSQSTATTTATTLPLPVVPGVVLPGLRVTSDSCSHHRCTVIVAGRDTGGPGVGRVTATLTELERVACKLHGKHATCTKAVPKPTSIKGLSGGRFEITAAGLRDGSYALVLLAVDKSGKRQAHATTIALTVSH